MRLAEEYHHRHHQPLCNMWNSSSRQWLVTDKKRSATNILITIKETRTNDFSSHCSNIRPMILNKSRTLNRHRIDKYKNSYNNNNNHHIHNNNNNNNSNSNNNNKNNIKNNVCYDDTGPLLETVSSKSTTSKSKSNKTSSSLSENNEVDLEEDEEEEHEDGQIKENTRNNDKSKNLFNDNNKVNNNYNNNNNNDNNKNSNNNSNRRKRPKSIDTRVNKLLCLNQIVEVLLAIFLANCLLPHTQAAFDYGISSSGSSSSSSSSNKRSRFSSGSSFSNGIDYEEPDDLQQLQDVSNLWQTQSAFRQQRFNSVGLSTHQTNYKISPKPCSISGIDGTCMFVWECIKSEGRHVGMCVDAFMFGSCCVHNYTDNIVMPPSFSYTRPTKPGLLGVGGSGIGSGGGSSSYSGINQQHRPRPPPFAGTPHRPVISGMTTIERPHGAGTLVIRPSGPHHQGSLQRPHPYSTKSPLSVISRTTIRPTTRPTTTKKNITTTTQTTGSGITSLWNPHATNDMQTSASFAPSAVAAASQSLSTWNSLAGVQQHYMSTLAGISNEPTAMPAKGSTTTTAVLQHWHMTTEPNFITKPRPPSWEKPLPPSRPKPKPTKPTKSPLTPSFVYTSHHRNKTTTTSTTTRRPTTTTTTTTTTKTTTALPTTFIEQTTKARPQIPQYTIRPSPTTMRPIMRPPTPVWITSESAFSHEHFNKNFSFSTTSFKPTISRTTTTTTTTTTLPPRTTEITTKATTTTTNKPTTTMASSTSEAAAKPTALSSSNLDTVLPTHKNYSNIEINEIADTSNSDGTIKLISAARSECGVPTITRPETRIVGGKSSVFGHWPWQVSVRRTTFFGFSSTHRCGGALINENWISTAGHCVDDLLISQIRIRVGEYDFAHVQEQLQYIERGVVKKVVHPKYNFYTYEYDLSLVKLETPLDFAPHVSPICLPQTDSLLIGMNATVTGWGRLSEGGTLPSVLQEASVPIVSNDNCKSMFLRAGRLEIIPEIFLCAGYETGGQDSCQGDSGGPLQVKAQDGRYFLAGIISWGIGCAEANLPGVCTRISKFVPWIMENVT